MKATTDHFKQFLVYLAARFCPETVLEQYKVYSKCKSLRGGVAV